MCCQWEEDSYQQWEEDSCRVVCGRVVLSIRLHSAGNTQNIVQDLPLHKHSAGTHSAGTHSSGTHSAGTHSSDTHSSGTHSAGFAAPQTRCRILAGF